MDNDLTLVTVQNNQPVTTSLIIAEGTSNQHKNVLELISKYSGAFERWGSIEFRVLNAESKGGRPTRIAYLNEQQATFLITLLRNNDIVLAFKSELVDQFYRMREALQKQFKRPMSAVDVLLMTAEALKEQQAQLQQHSQQISQVEDNLSSLTETVDETKETAEQALETANEAIKKVELETAVASRYDTMLDVKTSKIETRVNTVEDEVDNIKEKLVDITELPQTVSVDFRNCVSMMVENIQKYQDMTKGKAHQQATEDLLADISEEAGHVRSYIATRRKKNREKLILQGFAEAFAKREVTGITIIDTNPVLKAATLRVVRRIESDIRKANLEVKLVL